MKDNFAQVNSQIAHAIDFVQRRISTGIIPESRPKPVFDDKSTEGLIAYKCVQCRCDCGA